MQIVGYDFVDGPGDAFIWTLGVGTEAIPSAISAFGVTDSGVVVGRAEFTVQVNKKKTATVALAYRYDSLSEAMEPIGEDFSVNGSTAHDINTHGDIVGYSALGEFIYNDLIGGWSLTDLSGAVLNTGNR